MGVSDGTYSRKAPFALK